MNRVDRKVDNKITYKNQEEWAPTQVQDNGLVVEAIFLSINHKYLIIQVFSVVKNHQNQKYMKTIQDFNNKIHNYFQALEDKWFTNNKEKVRDQGQNRLHLIEVFKILIHR
jgi:hypothetical protein